MAKQDEESRAQTPVEAFIAPADSEQAKMRRRQRAEMRKKDQEARLAGGPPTLEEGYEPPPPAPATPPPAYTDEDPSKSQFLDDHLRGEEEPDDTLPSLGRATPTSQTSLIQDKKK